MAELIRRGMDAYVQACAEPDLAVEWTMPILRGSGGHKIDSPSLRLEADAMISRFDG